MGLRPLPASFASTRQALHLVAERLVAPARKPDNEIALTVTQGGFGTPPFQFEGARWQVRVEADALLLERDGAVTSAPIESLAAGGALLGPELLPGGQPGDAEPLAVDREAAECLAGFYAFASQLLERLRAGLAPDDKPSAIDLWPEHFDIALEAGAEARGARATYGASPGDDDHAEPYLYVLPWARPPEGELWNAIGFNGAELPYAELVSATDPETLASEFIAARRAALSR